uniref:Serine incorporator 1 n=1 Tax=Lygus hesperus TaxID=30085 RepID=A0A0A9YV79_LYGHE
MFYTTFLLFVAFSSNDNCSPTSSYTTPSYLIYINCVIIFLLICNISYTVFHDVKYYNSNGHSGGVEIDGPLSTDETAHTVAAAVAQEIGGESEASTLAHTKRYLCLYLFMLTFAAMYLVEQFSGWGIFGRTDDGTSASLYYQCVGSFLVLAVYGWTLFAPLIFANRSFG